MFFCEKKEDVIAEANTSVDGADRSRRKDSPAKTEEEEGGGHDTREVQVRRLR